MRNFFVRLFIVFLIWESWRSWRRKKRLGPREPRSERNKSVCNRNWSNLQVFLSNDFFLSILLYLWDCLPTLRFLEVLKRFPISDQVFDWLLGVFAGVVSFLFDKVLFDSSLSLFIEDCFHFVFLMRGYFDPLFLYFCWFEC